MPRKQKSDKRGQTSAIPFKNSDLKSELESRFMSYAMSTIVARALPDVRDGLKPVHRRVIYAMSQLRLFHDSRFRKCASVVGEMIGKYHPHGDQSAYDALVRMAQDFSMRYPLVEGHGNFGNVDGDSPGAMRYTEARLAKLAGEMLGDLKKNTVEFYPTFDGENKEPRLLPSLFPNLLVNGSSGIAVGIATNIPPHNMKEVIDAALALTNDPSLESKQLLKYLKGPDFPTGGQILTSREDLRNIYETGHGSIKIRAQWEIEEVTKSKWQIIVTSIPYSINKSALLAKIGELIVSKRIQLLVDVRDESTEDIRIVLEPKGPEVDPEMAMSFLFKNSDLQLNYHINLTALTPSLRPERHSLRQILTSFLQFKDETVRKRLEYDLGVIKERLQVLVAYLKAHSNLDEIVDIIKKSKSREEARQKLMDRLKLNEFQANAILDLRLASLVGMEMSKIKAERKEKEAEKERLETLLKNKSEFRKLIIKELTKIKSEYGDKRRSVIQTSSADEPEYKAEDFIEHEETHVIVSRDGWIRRVKTLSRPETLRFKSGDSCLAWLPMTTRDLVCFFTSNGKVYCIKALDVSQTTGFGDPVQSIFKFADKERVVAAMGIIQPGEEKGAKKSKSAQGSIFDQLDTNRLGSVYGYILEKETKLLLATENGNGFRFSSEVITETTKSGKKIANVKQDDAVMVVTKAAKPYVFALSSDGRGLKFSMEEVPILNGPGAGVRFVKLKPGQTLAGLKVIGDKDKLTLTYLAGKEDTFKALSLELGARGTVGRVLASKRKKLMGLTTR